MYVGAVEDTVKSPNPLAAKARIGLARLAGFSAIRMTAIWSPGQTELDERARVELETATAAASLHGMKVILAVHHWGSRTTPLTPGARSQFAEFTASLARSLPSVSQFVIGNEPNLNRFWMPQFNRDGSNAAARAYFALLAETYDALKEVSPEIEVIGGALSPRGNDDPRSRRHTHSPTRFILDLGRAYWRSGRTEPIMDAFALHPYLERSRTRPSLEHPLSTTISIADYPKLVALLGKAFAGTPQRGSTLPIVYGEFGVQSRIPPRKRRIYTHRKSRSAADAVPERVQAAYYREALALAFCQPTVKAFLIFHVNDERDLRRWQSGLYYADRKPKSSLRPVRRAVRAVHLRRIARCRKGRVVSAGKSVPAKRSKRRGRRG